METVQIRCGRCNSLMAVPGEFLGRQVRCPHCQHVVLAPASSALQTALDATGTASAQPSEVLGSDTVFLHDEERHDRFVPTVASEGSFDEDATLRLEIVAETVRPSSDDLREREKEVQLPASGSVPVAESRPLPEFREYAVEGTDTAYLDAIPPNPVSRNASSGRSPRRKHGWLLGAVFLPLFLYSILATVAIVLLWNRLQQTPPHPLEMFPDVEGDTPGVQKNGKKTSPVRGQIAPEHVKKLADAALPSQLRVSLGETLRVGDLEVTPRRVDRKVVRVFVEGFANPEPCLHESLVLQLHLHNASADSTFTPIDNYFDRRWKKGGGPPPLTVLEMGPQRFYGGPAEWSPLGSAGNVRRQWVEGRKDFDALGVGPGADMDTFVCTDGDDAKVLQELEKFPGKLLWRVQLRRGLVRVGNRDIPAAAVVGVEFNRHDVDAAGRG
jgi:hypothetical protein